MLFSGNKVSGNKIFPGLYHESLFEKAQTFEYVSNATAPGNYFHPTTRFL